MINTSIIITVKDGDFLEWMDKDLPIPSNLTPVKNYGADYWNDPDERTAYKITYAIDGYFGTSKGKNYLHDIASRLAYCLSGSYEIEQHYIDPSYIYTLTRFNHLERIPSFLNDLESNAWNGSRNEIFNALRNKAYQMHRFNILNLEALKDYGNRISNNSDHVKYLANNIFKWVENYYTPKVSIMTRSQAGVNASKIKSQRVKNKIFNALRYEIFFKTSSMANDAKRLNVSWTTFKKYKEELQRLQQALILYKRASNPLWPLVLIGFEHIKEVLKNCTIWALTKDHLNGLELSGCTSPPQTAFKAMMSMKDIN